MTSFVQDLEYDLMRYCIKQKGKWWANHFFRNKEVGELYSKLRLLDTGTVISIVQRNAPHEKAVAYKIFNTLDIESKCYLCDKEQKHSIGYCNDHYPEFVERVNSSVDARSWAEELIRMVEVFLDDDKPMAIPDYEAYRDLLRDHMGKYSK